MSKSNLRVTLDAFTANVKENFPCTLRFDGKQLSLNVDGRKGTVGLTSDLTDDTCYRITGDDIEDVAGEMGEKLTDKEMSQVQYAIGDGFSDTWHDVVEQAIQNVVSKRAPSQGVKK
jgi:hypothetical protein